MSSGLFWLPHFGDWMHEGQPLTHSQPAIASLSFGAIRTFHIRDRTGKRRTAIDLEPGSILLVDGDAVARWWHSVPKTARRVGPRVNLTFRHMV